MDAGWFARFGQLLVGQMVAKVALSVALVPFLIVFFVRLGKRLDA